MFKNNHVHCYLSMSWLDQLKKKAWQSCRYKVCNCRMSIRSKPCTVHYYTTCYLQSASMSSLMVHLNFLKQKLAELNCLCKIYVLHVLMMELALYILVCLIEGESGGSFVGSWFAIDACWLIGFALSIYKCTLYISAACCYFSLQLIIITWKNKILKN